MGRGNNEVVDSPLWTRFLVVRWFLKGHGLCVGLLGSEILVRLVGTTHKCPYMISNGALSIPKDIQHSGCRLFFVVNSGY